MTFQGKGVMKTASEGGFHVGNTDGKNIPDKSAGNCIVVYDITLRFAKPDPIFFQQESLLPFGGYPDQSDR